jgi:hypothetical protein
MSTGIIDFGSTTLRSDEIVADTHVKIGATTPATNVKLHATGTAPQIRLQDTASGTASGALVCDSGAFQFQTGADFTNNAVGEFRFASVGGTHKFLTIKGNNSDVTESNVAVGGDLIVDSDSHLKGTLAVNTAAFVSDGSVCQIAASTTDPAKPTLHVFDSALDVGDYGMVQLTRDGTSPGNKAHLAFIRNGNSVLGMGFHNNTNTFGLFPSLVDTTGVTATPGLAITSDSKVGIATSAPQEALHVNGNIRLGGPSGTDAASTVEIKSTSEMIVHAAESDTNSQYCFAMLRAGTSANLGQVAVGGGGSGASGRAITFTTSNSEASRIDASGYWKHSKMPAFSAYSTAGNTLKAVLTPIALEHTMFNTGSHYSTSTGAFTAPVSGMYQFNAAMWNQSAAVQGSSQTIQWAWLYRATSSGTWDEITPSIFDNGVSGGDHAIWDSEPGKIGTCSFIIKLGTGSQFAVGMRETSVQQGNFTIYLAHCHFSGFLYSAA